MKKLGLEVIMITATISARRKPSPARSAWIACWPKSCRRQGRQRQKLQGEGKIVAMVGDASRRARAGSG